MPSQTLLRLPFAPTSLMGSSCRLAKNPITPTVGEGLVNHPWLPKYGDRRNLVPFPHLPHTRFTYHRTWETGLETEIRVADFSPAFFVLPPDSPFSLTPDAASRICII